MVTSRKEYIVQTDVLVSVYSDGVYMRGGPQWSTSCRTWPRGVLEVSLPSLLIWAQFLLVTGVGKLDGESG